jgi:hypothetical protein
MYNRVIPRDFFNESKLLKCLGQFELAVVDRQCAGLDIKTELLGNDFQIDQNSSDGSLYCANYKASLEDESIHLSIPYNSKDAYPLLAEFRGEIYYVFDSKGRWMPNLGRTKVD